MPWSAILDWLQSNWLGVVTLAVVGFGAVTSWRHFRRSKRDVTPRVFFRDEEGGRREKIEVEHRGESASPFTVDLVVANVGGSKLKRGKLTLTLSHGLQAVDSPGWEEGTPNALVRDASAVSHSLPTIGRNDRVHPTPAHPSRTGPASARWPSRHELQVAVGGLEGSRRPRIGRPEDRLPLDANAEVERGIQGAPVVPVTPPAATGSRTPGAAVGSLPYVGWAR